MASVSINIARSATIRLKKYSAMLIGASLFFASSFSGAQVVTIDLSAERDFVYQDGVYSNIGESVLPFVITLHNPSTETINDIEFGVGIGAGASVGNVDSQCIETVDTSTLLVCTIDELKANRSKTIDFYVDGPNSLGAGEGFIVSVASNDATILEPDAVEATLADGDRRIRGASLFVHLVRNIDIDLNQNTIPDLDELIIDLPPNASIEEYLAREAVIDVLFVHSPAAEAYLGSKLQVRVDQIISIANQVFSANDVAIKFKSVGLEQIPYTATDTEILNTFDALVAQTDPAFDGLGNLVTMSGGDIVVMMHAIDTSTSPECGWTTLNAVGRQGDFQSLYHQGKLLSAINVGPECLGRYNLAPVFASNMGIARERARSPDGGTFSFSAAYGVANSFSTIASRIGTPTFGAALPIEEFSNPDKLCLGSTCGVDRSDIANGADAVYSLNKTRHLVSALTPTVTHTDPSAIEDKIAQLGNLYDLEVLQTTVETSAIVNEFTEFNVSVTNTSAVTLSDIDVQLAHVSDGSLVDDPQFYETSSSLCTILGSTLSATEIVVGDARQKLGTLSCTIDSIAPDESIEFNYRIQIDGTPPILDNATYYHEVVAINGVPQLESLACIPVFLSFVDANVGSGVCGAVAALPLTFGPQTPENLTRLTTVTGNRLSVPFIRLDDGGLISAEFQITFFGEVRFELLSYEVLDSTLVPNVEATFSDAGVLSLPNVLVAGINYDIAATLEPDSDPVKLGSLNITLVETGL